jgi:hypothetical protein
MSTTIIGDKSWEALVRASIAPVPSRPAGGITYAEFCQRFGLKPNSQTTRDRFNATLRAGLLRKVRGTALGARGRLQCACYYVPAKP